MLLNTVLRGCHYFEDLIIYSAAPDKQVLSQRSDCDDSFKVETAFRPMPSPVNRSYRHVGTNGRPDDVLADLGRINYDS
jgi:hypothetical protein